MISKVKKENWIEFSIAFVVGIATGIFVQDVVVGVLSTIALTSIAFNRFLIDIKLDEQLKSIKKQEQKIDEINSILSAQAESICDLSTSNQLVLLSKQIKHRDLRNYKRKIYRDAVEKLEYVVKENRSLNLETDEYYVVLFDFLKEITDTNPGLHHIWAISINNTVEWDNSSWENKFLELNLKAVEAGVQLERVFVVNNDELPKLLNNKAIAKQFEYSKKYSNCQLSIALIGELQRSNLLYEIGHGLIAFDDQKALIDIFDEERQTIRGYLDINPDVLRKKMDVFKKLLVASRPFAEALELYSTSAGSSSHPMPEQSAAANKTTFSTTKSGNEI